MAALQVDVNGNRIKTDILTSGYLRQDIENEFKISIPSEIRGLCFEFWFIKVCDEWDKSYHAENTDIVEFNGQIAKRKIGVSSIYVTLYGSHSAKSGEYEWRLNIKSVGEAGICIGVIEDEEENLKKHHKDFDYDLYGYGCWWFADGSVSAQDNMSRKVFTKSFRRNHAFVMNDVIIGIKINIETKKISYSIDGDDYIEAPLTLTKDKYRLAVTLFNLGDEIELL